MKKLLLALALLFSTEAVAQIPGNAPSGGVYANSSASARPGRWETATAWLDRWCSSTNEAFPRRTGGSWACTVLGTGVATALQVNTGSAGAVVLFNGAGGTPSSITLTNATACAISTCVSGLGTGVATFLATPSSANLAAALTDETGSGAAVFAAGSTLTGTIFSQNWFTRGVITPTALSGDVNDYNPTSLATSNVIRQDGGAANRNITGLTAQSAGTKITLINIGTTNNLVLKNASASSSAANRFDIGSDITLTPSQSAMVWYDTTSSRWRLEAVFAGAGGVTSIAGNTGAFTLSTGLTNSTNDLRVDIASAAQVQAGTASKIVDASVAASSGALTALTDAATVAVDMATGINFSVTLGGNRTLGAPTNTQVGRCGFIRITQDGTGSRTLAYNAVWKFVGGVAPVLTTTAGAIDFLYYCTSTSTFFVATLLSDVK